MGKRCEQGLVHLVADREIGAPARDVDRELYGTGAAGEHARDDERKHLLRRGLDDGRELIGIEGSGHVWDWDRAKLRFHFDGHISRDAGNP